MSEEKYKVFADGPEGLERVNLPVFIIKDSGYREKFSSGMARDTAEGKTDYYRLFEGPMLQRWADHLTKGAVKYPDVQLGKANWTLAEGEEELIRFKKSAARHFVQWLRGDVEEDHASALYFNVNGYEYVKEKMYEKLNSPETTKSRGTGGTPRADSGSESLFVTGLQTFSPPAAAGSRGSKD